jgi:hypothetical protein
MSSYLVIGDPHFRECSMADMELFSEEVLKLAREHAHKIQSIVVLGDVMDRHGILHQKPYHQACKFLLDLSKIKHTYCLIGNHDFDNPSRYLPENHPFKVMTWSGVPSLTIVDRPMKINNVMFVPYVPPGSFQRALDEGGGIDGVGLIFAHQEFRGCRMGRIVSEMGDPWPMDDFGKHPYIVSGHIHDHQMVGENIMYTGTPIQVNFGEGEKRGVCIFDAEFKRSGLPKRVGSEWLKINIPRKITRTIHVDMLDSWARERFSELCHRYDLEGEVVSKRRKRREFEGFDFLASLHNMAHDPLSQKIASDKHLDRLRLQIKCPKTTPAIKFVVSLLRGFPLAIHSVFLIYEDQTDLPDMNQEDDIETKDWYEYVVETIEASDPGRVRDLMKEYTIKFV